LIYHLIPVVLLLWFIIVFCLSTIDSYTEPKL